MKIIVMGAGVVGISTAWYLAQQGHEVQVLERQPDAALETSFANGGQISVSHAEPWASPATPLTVLRWLGREDAPLLLRLRRDPALWRWCGQFLRECTARRHARNCRAIIQLALYSRACLQQLNRQLGDALAYDRLQRGILHIYTDAATYRAGQQAASLQSGFGGLRQALDAAQCLRLEPALQPVAPRLLGGDYAAQDESGDAHLFTRQLAAQCRLAGVRLLYGQSIARLERRQGRVSAVITADGQHHVADAYVLALGSHGPALLRPHGIRLPVYPVKGYSATFELSADSIAPQVSLIDDEYKIVFSRLGQRLRVAGTAEFTGFDTWLNPVRCALLERRCKALFPELNAVGAPEFWAGLRPVTPTAVPMIGRMGFDNLWLNTGHGTLGWTLACGSAAALGDLISGCRPALDFPFIAG